MDSLFPQPICETVWGSKYQFKTEREGFMPDLTVHDTWDRIATSCASSPRFTTAEAQAAAHKRFYDILENFKFSPAGRIIAGSGTGRNVTLFNCFVMGTVPDSLAGIFDMLKEAALTMQQGGGIGYDFSTIRPKTAFVKGVEAEASGPLSFMDVWDKMCETIMSAGGRRGAMMATMACNHPDVLDFITAKRTVGRLNKFNMSVLVTDELMNKVKTEEDIALVHVEPPMIDSGLGQDADGKYIYEYINARDLWEAIMAETYHHAEPGVIFIDRINRENNLWFAETIAATNPCGEQPLPPYGACLLGSINLTKFVDNPFTPEASFRYGELERVMATAVELTDCVIDASNFPLEKQREEAELKRRMGIGVTGLADAMYMLGTKYGSESSQEFTREVLKVMAIAGYQASADLAKEYGPAPIFAETNNRKLALEKGMIRKLPVRVKESIMENGLRNSHILSIAPTGTMSIYMGNVSSGVEPNFADSYVRKVLQKDGTKIDERVYASAVLVFTQLYDQADDTRKRELDNWRENFWCTAQDLAPEDHVAVQAAAQEWVDSSISKTVNLPEDISMEDFASVYVDAFDQGCKGCTTYRPNDILGSVLSVEPEKKDEPEETVEPPVEPVVWERPYELSGKTYKLKWQGDAVYLTFNDIDAPEGWRAPFEMFVTTKNPEHAAWIGALTRMISAIFRRGGDIRFIIEELKNVHDPKGGAWVDGKYCPSLVALLGRTLETHLMRIGYQSTPEPVEITVYHSQATEDGPEAPEEPEVQIVVAGTPNQCPSCGEYAMVEGAGCSTCTSCGYSKCG
ncbi:ribonucleotide reductase [Roseobacter phage RD-1410W1-01]|uniref:Vitamin B12-dependent ribonucleotide reductase n=1 Tax=Roseobacter phage RD-1410W1-01 TaxID=1815984 RepID=A0A191VYJ2_9CAUD|nr:ribonucleotide reductase [Roseobacter phage RD-1410W1-01]ANJ20787.1 class II ribonucleotide reductase [Roseobacter phage RD-1410W1-01]